MVVCNMYVSQWVSVILLLEIDALMFYMFYS